MSDEQLDRLGFYFVHLGIREQFGITFDFFIELNKSGQWEKLAK